MSNPFPPSNAPKLNGRPPGALNKITRPAKKIIEEAFLTGLTPLQYMLWVMRDETAPVERRDSMALAAAPYMHPRLQAITHSGSVTGTANPHDLADADLETIARAGRDGADAPPQGQSKLN